MRGDVLNVLFKTTWGGAVPLPELLKVVLQAYGQEVQHGPFKLGERQPHRLFAFKKAREVLYKSLEESIKNPGLWGFFFFFF